MSQPSLDAAATAYRRKMMAKTIGFAVLVAVIWLQPRIQAWLDGRKTGGSDVVVNHDADPSNTTQRPADRKRVIIKDVDESPVAEVDRLKAAGAPIELPEVHIRGDADAEYRCIGGVIFTMQRSGYQKVGFISEPPPGFVTR